LRLNLMILSKVRCASTLRFICIWWGSRNLRSLVINAGIQWFFRKLLIADALFTGVLVHCGHRISVNCGA
jgi:hypothetical protein